MDDSAFLNGNPIWAKGEKFRKNGDYFLAMKEYMEAERVGYRVPALYRSMVMAQQKLGDLEGVIDTVNRALESFANDDMNVNETHIDWLKHRKLIALRKLTSQHTH